MEASLDNELVQFAELLKSNVVGAIYSTKNETLENQYYKFLMDNSLESRFPNVEIAFAHAFNEHVKIG